MDLDNSRTVVAYVVMESLYSQTSDGLSDGKDLAGDRAGYHILANGHDLR